MSLRSLLLYAGFFLAMLAAALALTGVLQQGILPRLNSLLARRAPEKPAVSSEGTPGSKVAAPASEGTKPETAPDEAAEARAAEIGATAADTQEAENLTPAPAAAPSGRERRSTAQAETEGPAPPAPARPAMASGQDATPQIKRLARVYEGMRPKEAASVLEKLDRPFAARILAEIRERQAARILGNMNPAAAAELSRLLTLATGGAAS
jgi:flagellar motility protein MotE (MotC chaperone)